MSVDVSWADHVIVMATALCLEVDMAIITSSAEANAENCVTWVLGSVGGDPLVIGHYHENHYQSLQPIQGRYLKRRKNS